MPKPPDMGTLLLESFRESNKTQSRIVEAVNAVRDAIFSIPSSISSAFSGFASGGAQAVPGNAAGAGSFPSAPDTFGLKPDTVSGTDSTYALKDPIEKSSTMAPTQEVPTLQEANSGDLFSAALAPLIQIVQQIHDAMGGSGGMAGGAKAILDDGANVAHSASEGVSAGGEIGEALGVLTGTLGVVAGAASALADTFSQFVSVSMKFVEALNPALLIPLNLAFEDLSAVVGTALTPIIAGASVILRSFADVLTPIMAGLQPVVQKLTQAFVDLSGPFIESFGKLAESLMPLIEMAANIVQGFMLLIEAVLIVVNLFNSMLMPVLSVFMGIVQAALIPFTLLAELFMAFEPIMKVMSAVFAGISAAIQAFVGNLVGGDQLKDTFAGLHDTMVKFSQQVILAIASLAQMFGFTNFLDGFIKALKPAQRGTSTGMAAIENTAFKSFESFGKDMALTAAKAGVGGADVKEVRKPEDILGGIAVQLKAIQDNKDGVKVSKETISAIATAFRSVLAEVLKKPAYEVSEKVVVGALGPVGSLIDLFS